MDSMNGVTSTGELSTTSALPNGNVPSRGTSEPPPDVDEQPSKTHIQDWCLYILAGVVVVGFYGLTVLLMLGGANTSEGNKEIAFMLFGGLVTGFSMVLSYFFGSSAGSAQKTLELAKMAKNK